MAQVVLFHHVQGLTDGVRAFAEELRTGGHTVHTPDLFEGALPESIDGGMALTGKIGDDVLGARADASVADLPMAWCTRASRRGRRSTATRPDPIGCARSAALRGLLPDYRRVGIRQVAGRRPVPNPRYDEDPFFGKGGDLDAARELVETVGPELAELFAYPGDRHLFTDSSLPSYEPEATALVIERSRAFLDRLS